MGDEHLLGLADGRPRLFCDLTQSWSEVGGGVGTYIRHKRRHILDNTEHRHLLIVPGAEDKIIDEGRAITVTVRSPHVPGSPNGMRTSEISMIPASRIHPIHSMQVS